VSGTEADGVADTMIEACKTDGEMCVYHKKHMGNFLKNAIMHAQSQWSNRRPWKIVNLLN